MSPPPVSMLITSTLQPCARANFWYSPISSYAKSDASSPPVPALTSTMAPSPQSDASPSASLSSPVVASALASRRLRSSEPIALLFSSRSKNSCFANSATSLSSSSIISASPSSSLLSVFTSSCISTSSVRTASSRPPLAPRPLLAVSRSFRSAACVSRVFERRAWSLGGVADQINEAAFSRGSAKDSSLERARADNFTTWRRGRRLQTLDNISARCNSHARPPQELSRALLGRPCFV
mmetsp:Transcript_25779/g.57790  ORF Transcript_25779/g.57790 Transcript_25779/m.57790 type:complete len:238 (-) Transcript_25779:20-733(-)